MTLQSNNTKFILLIIVQAVLWAALGTAASVTLHWPLEPFLLLLAATTVSLFLLIRLIKILLDTRLSISMKLVQFILFSFFKLVCIVFLAITLKRFQELPYLALVVGASFYWMAPAIAGLLCSKE